MPIGLQTTGDQTMVEDVTDLITNVDFESTPFYSSLAESSATNTLGRNLDDNTCLSVRGV